MKIFTVAHLPDHLVQAWLQHLRNFDVTHDGCHFDVMSDAPAKTLDEMVGMLQVKPELSFSLLLDRKIP